MINQTRAELNVKNLSFHDRRGKALLQGVLPVSGEPISGELANHKFQAMVFQKTVVLRASVQANIEWALHDCAPTTRQALLDEAISVFGLQTLRFAPAHRCSGGELQRLALARAWVRRPRLLFLDEPSAHLDAQATLDFENWIKNLLGLGVGVIMSTHDQDQVRRLPGRCLQLRHGTLMGEN
jgi:tungstate transport system ATP-binding protein